MKHVEFLQIGKLTHFSQFPRQIVTDMDGDLSLESLGGYTFYKIVTSDRVVIIRSDQKYKFMSKQSAFVFDSFLLLRLSNKVSPLSL